MRFLTLITLAVLMTSNSPVSTAKEPTTIPEIEMVEVKGGTFVMGLDESEAEHSYETPRHQVALSDFRIGKYEVTQDLWEAVMGDNPSSSKGDRLPVESVSWNDIQIFIKKLNKITGRNTVCRPRLNGSMRQEARTRLPAMLSSGATIQTLRHGVLTTPGGSHIQ